MNFPVWEVPLLGGGMLIAAIAVFHVFISHFAVGGGFFLVLTERKAYRDNNTAMLQYVKKHSKFFLLLTLVLGAVTGVAIWFVIGLVQPSGTSALIHSFVWGWAIEWVFFIVEVLSIIIYVAMWDKMDRATHLTIGWIYAASGFLTLAVINGIVSFMLTPGPWLETKSFWDGVFNPTYFPSLLTRFLVALMFAGVYAFLTSTRLKDKDTRAAITKYAATWVLPALLLLPFAFWWYYAQVPDSAKEIINGGIPYIQATAVSVIISTALLLLFVLVGPFWRPRSFNFYQAVIVLLVASAIMFSWERVREAARKPFIIDQYMYANGVRVDDFDAIQSAGLLASGKWFSQKTLDESNEVMMGKEIFRAQCASCHTIDGYQNIRQYLVDRTFDDLDVIVSDLSSFRGFMPPFAGTDGERTALVKYLMTVKPAGSTKGGQP